MRRPARTTPFVSIALHTPHSGDGGRDGGAVEFFTLKRHPDTTGKVVAWCIIAASAVFGFWSLESSESDMESTIGAVIALAGMLFGARMLEAMPKA